jgi:hypothetical protein
VPNQPQRRLTLLDVMVLVAATACVFALYRWYDFIKFYANLFSETGGMWTRATSTRCAIARVGHLVPYLLWPAQLVLSVWTLALFGLRWVPPRPPRRRLATQPGTVACGLVSLVVVVEVLLALVVQWGLKSRTPFSIKAIQDAAILATSGDAFRHVMPRAGWAVAAAWLILAMGGRWRPEPDWIDRAGRIIGAAWIAQIPFYTWVIIYFG